MTTPPDRDAATGIGLVATAFVLALASDAWVIAIVTGLVLVVVVLALA